MQPVSHQTIPCIKCKGSNPANCGRTFCPLVAKSQAMFRVKDEFVKATDSNFFGSAPAPFVGRFGYPAVNVGILAPPEIKEDAWLHDAPLDWAKNNFSIQQIIDLRSSLINSRFKSDVTAVRSGRSRLLEISQEVGLAKRPVEVEINLKRAPTFRLEFSPDTAPMGPRAELSNAKITSNPHIDTRVDKVNSDTDLRAADAMNYLYDRGFDENFLSKILSVGTLGLGKNRKLVPTRWSITATDDILAKNLAKEIEYNNEIDHLAFFGQFLGNNYLILFFPGLWGYELFEMYQPNVSWNQSADIQFTTDHEGSEGRKTYAENCAGGYYSVRLAVLERLKSLHKRGTAIVIRIITKDYEVPLGVWVTREASRKALSNKPIEFKDKDLILKYAVALGKKKFGMDLSIVLNSSVLLKQAKTQKRLSDFTS